MLSSSDNSDPVFIEIVSKGICPLDSLDKIWSEIEDAVNGFKDIILLSKTTKTDKYSIVKQLELKSCKTNTSYPVSRFSVLVKVIKLLRCNLRNGSLTTYRDIYYQDVALFQRKQRNAVQAINQIANSLNVSVQKDLNIVPGQKGLAYGNIKLMHLGEGSIIDCSEPGLIPLLVGDSPGQYCVLQGNPRGIIVLEKEAVFRSICRELRAITDHSLIIVTGKGFPCQLTKDFLRLLALHFPQIPILAFVDSDIYGVQICANYSLNQATNGKVKESYEELIRNENTEDLDERLVYAGIFLLEYETGWLNVETREWKRMQNFLIQRNGSNATSITERRFYTEISRGMILHKKCEMNSISESYLAYILRALEKEEHRRLVTGAKRRKPNSDSETVVGQYPQDNSSMDSISEELSEDSIFSYKDEVSMSKMPS